MNLDKDGLASLGKPRSEMSRAELYDMIDGLQETVMLCAQRLASARGDALEEAAKLIEAFSPIRPAFETEDEGGTKWPHPAVQLPIYNPQDAATAIRALKEVR